MNINKKKPFVVYWNNIPTPYMVERFNAVADRNKLEFEAWFNDRKTPERSWDIDENEWNFNYNYLHKTRLADKTFHWPLLLLKRRPDVLVSLYAEPSFLFGWLIAKLRGTRTVFWCQVTINRVMQRKVWKNFIKRIVFPRVDATIGNGDESRAFAMSFGTSAEKALRLRHSIDVKHFMKTNNNSYQERNRFRDELGLVGSTFIYVGHLYWVKGTKYLLDAFQIVQKKVRQEVSLLLVGDGPDVPNLKKYCKENGIRNVIFAGFIQKPELPAYYAVADVFVFPTLGDTYGLVVDEAMACSLPIISTSAVGEIRDRIEDGINGYIVPSENSQVLAERMELLISDEELRLIMGKISASKIVGNTPQKWAEDFERIIFNIIEKS